MLDYDVAIIGGGPGGISAAIRLAEMGLKKIVLIERDNFLGGILPQCIHCGFGIKELGEQLTGPEYAQIFIDKLFNLNVELMLNTMALAIDKNKSINVIGKNNGIKEIKSKSIILALGCRERTRGAINIPGSRPSGIFTAGLAQRLVNIEGYLPGENIIILGSGDIGLIMARRLRLEGCNVKGVFEIMPFSSGLKRNIIQCLFDYDIPLYLNHTVTDIYGNERIEAVDISEVDEDFNIIKKSRKRIPCDSLILSVGLIPENELAKSAGIRLDENSGGPYVNEFFETSVSGIFSCGNSLYVNDLVDNVTQDGYLAAENAFKYLKDRYKIKTEININTNENINYVIPQKVSGKFDVEFRIRVKRPIKDAVVEMPEIKFERKLKFITPGEMVFLNVASKYFSNFDKTKNIINLNIKGTYYKENQIE